jgi:hypothetical protein
MAFDVSQFLNTAAQIYGGSLQGQMQADQERKLREQQAQQQQLQYLQLGVNLQDQERAARLRGAQAIAPYAASGAQADLFNAAFTPQGPQIGVSDLQRVMAGGKAFTGVGQGTPPPAQPYGPGGGVSPVAPPPQSLVPSVTANYAPPVPVQPPVQPAQTVSQQPVQQTAFTPPWQAPMALPETPVQSTAAQTTPAVTETATPVAAPARPRTVRFLGRDIPLRGVTKEQSAGMVKLVADAKKFVDNYRGDEATRKALAGQLDLLPTSFDDETSYAAGQKFLDVVNPHRAGNSLASQTMDYQRIDRARTSYNNGWKSFIEGKQSPSTAARTLVNLFQSENDLRGRLPAGEQADAPRNLEDWGEEIAGIEAALAKKTPEGRQEAAQLAEEVTSALVNQKSPQDMAAQTRLMLEVVGKLDPEKSQDKGYVARALRQAGLPDAAKRVLRDGVNFQGYNAKKELRILMGQASTYSTLPRAARKLYTDQLIGAARATGQAVDIKPGDFQKFDPAAKLRLLKLGQEVAGFKTREARADAYLTLAQNKYKDDKAKVDGAASQLTENARARLPYQLWQNAEQKLQSFLSRFKVSEAASDIAELEPDQQKEYRRLRGMVKRSKSGLLKYFSDRGTMVDLGDEEEDPLAAPDVDMSGEAKQTRVQERMQNKATPRPAAAQNFQKWTPQQLIDRRRQLQQAGRR